jgi:hypothetical protein
MLAFPPVLLSIVRECGKPVHDWGGHYNGQTLNKSITLKKIVLTDSQDTTKNVFKGKKRKAAN